MSVYNAKFQKGLEALIVSNAGAASTGYRRLEARTDGWYDIDTSGTASRLQMGTGWVNLSGTPVDNQIAVWTDADTIEGTTKLVYDGSTLIVTDSRNSKILIDSTSAGIGYYSFLEVRNDADKGANLYAFSSTYNSNYDSVSQAGKARLDGNGVDLFITAGDSKIYFGVSNVIRAILKAGDFDIACNLIPTVNNTYDLGGVSYQWKDLYVDGTAYIDSLTLTSGSTVHEIESSLTNDAAHIPTSAAVYTAISQSTQGWVNVSGTPVDNQIAVFTDADTVEGDAKLTWTGTTFGITDGTSNIFRVNTSSNGKLELGYIPSTATSYDETLNIGGNINFEAVRPPTSAELDTLSLSENLGGGTLAAGTYYYNVVFVDYEGRMCGATIDNGANMTITVSANSSVSLSGIATSTDKRVTKRWIMRTEVGGAYYLCYKLYEINDNTTTTWTDTGTLTPDQNYRTYRAPNKSAGAMKIGGSDYLYSDDYNTFFGKNVGINNTSGQSLIGLGYGALIANTTGEENVAIGLSAASSNTTGSGNIYINYAAGAYNNGSGNVGIGTNSNRLVSNTPAFSTSYNIAVGGHTCFNIPSNSTANIILGYQSLYNTGMTNTIAISYNIGIGHQALLAAGFTTGSFAGNVAIGYRAGYKLGYTTSVTYNVLIGYEAGSIGITDATANDGNGNVGVGFRSLYKIGGDYNVSLGYSSGYNTIGNYNVFVGAGAGYTNSTGASNVFIGYQAGYSETGSNKLYIENSNSTSPLIYGEFDNNYVKINGPLLEVVYTGSEPMFYAHNTGGTGGAAFRMYDESGASDWKFKATSAGFKIRDNGNSLDVINIVLNSAANVLNIDAAGDIAIGYNAFITGRLEVTATGSTSYESFVTGGAIKMGASTKSSPDAGTIEWNGSNFRGYNGATWLTLGSVGGGNVSNYGTPANNQIAVWRDSTTIEGDSQLTFDETAFTITDATFTVNHTTASSGIIADIKGDDTFTSGAITRLTMYDNAAFDNTIYNLALWNSYASAGTYTAIGFGDSYENKAMAAIVGGSNGTSHNGHLSFWIWITGGGGQLYEAVKIRNGGSSDIQYYVRSLNDGITSSALYYNTSTGEITYGSAYTGTVTISGTPVDNQIAVWTDADTIEGDSNFTWTGSTFVVAGVQTIDHGSNAGTLLTLTGASLTQDSVLSTIVNNSDTTYDGTLNHIVLNNLSETTDNYSSLAFFGGGGSTPYSAIVGRNTDYNNKCGGIELWTADTKDLRARFWVTYDGKIFIDSGGFGTGSTTNVLYYNSTTGEITYAAISAEDHGNLSGLSDDDHTQYALLAGRSGGQVLKGGSAANENLDFYATAHATQGSIRFYSNALFDTNKAANFRDTNSNIYSAQANRLNIYGYTDIYFTTNSGSAIWDGAIWKPASSGGASLGSSSYRWGSIYGSQVLELDATSTTAITYAEFKSHASYAAQLKLSQASQSSIVVEALTSIGNFKVGTTSIYSFSSTAVYPTSDAGAVLGGASNRWNKAYIADNIYIAGIANADSGIEITSKSGYYPYLKLTDIAASAGQDTIIKNANGVTTFYRGSSAIFGYTASAVSPGGNKTIDLGAASYSWNNLYVDVIQMNGETINNIQNASEGLSSSDNAFATSAAIYNAVVSRGYSLQCEAASSTHSSGTTYYFADKFSVGQYTGQGTYQSLIVPKAGTIKKVYIRFQRTNGTYTSGNLVVSIGVNNSFTQVGSVANYNTPQTFSNTSLNISVTAGQYLEIKVDVPTLSVSGSSVLMSGVIWIE